MPEGVIAEGTAPRAKRKMLETKKRKEITEKTIKQDTCKKLRTLRTKQDCVLEVLIQIRARIMEVIGIDMDKRQRITSP